MSCDRSRVFGSWVLPLSLVLLGDRLGLAEDCPLPSGTPLIETEAYSLARWKWNQPQAPWEMWWESRWFSDPGLLT